MRKWPDDYINRIICGDCLEVMKEMPDESVDMCMTSPPYWGLRDYGTEQIFSGDVECEHEWGNMQTGRVTGGGDRPPQTKWQTGPSPDSQQKRYTCLKCGAWKGQLGLEPTPELYIEHMVAIFHEVKRVLKKEGTLWLNIGDTYVSTPAGNPGCHGLGNRDKSASAYHSQRMDTSKVGLPPKCLCMIPERLAWALIQDGWILRNKIIWYKPNGMPSSVKDRFSNKWEYIFMFNKNSKTILWQHKKTGEWVYKQPLGTSGKEGIDWEWKEDKKVSLWHGFTYYFDLDAVREPHIWALSDKRSLDGQKHLSNGKCRSGKYAIDGVCYHPDGKNPGDVFEIPTQPFPEAHFAVFPERLCEKPIKAGCPEEGVFLDPFCGAGTALFVAKQLRRKFIGIDIKAEYCGMSEKRLAQGVL